MQVCTLMTFFALRDEFYKPQSRCYKAVVYLRNSWLCDPFWAFALALGVEVLRMCKTAYNTSTCRALSTMHHYPINDKFVDALPMLSVVLLRKACFF